MKVTLNIGDETIKLMPPGNGATAIEVPGRPCSLCQQGLFMVATRRRPTMVGSRWPRRSRSAAAKKSAYCAPNWKRFSGTMRTSACFKVAAVSTEPILEPVTLADVERRTLLAAGAHAAALAACDCLDEMGRHLEAAAGRARVGANMAALVAESERERRLQP